MMKNLLILVTLAIAIASCTDQNGPESPTPKEQSINFASHRSVQDAIDIAKMLRKTENARSWSLITEKDVTVVCSDKNGRSSENDTLLYVVNYGNNQGFTIISSPYEAEPIIAMVDEGDFNSEETSSNENFQYILDTSKRYVSASVSKLDTTLNKFTQYIPVPDPDTIYYPTVKTKRVSVEWNQTWPENMYFNGYYAGCIPVAIAQACSYFECPSSLSLTFPEKDCSSISFDWSNIKKHSTSEVLHYPPSSYLSWHYSTCEATEESHKNIARFIRQIAYDGNATMDSTGTRVSWSNVPGLLKKYLSTGYSFTYTSNQSKILELLTSTDGVALICGMNSNDIKNDHCWLIDGIQTFGYKIRTYYLPTIFESDGSGDISYFDTEYHQTLYHMNLGWGGNCNGYYTSTIFKPENVYEYDNSSYNSSDNIFDINFDFIFIH
jgi:hypothetical protein